jgi:hypothetical protein
MLDSATATELPHEQHDNAPRIGNPVSAILRAGTAASPSGRLSLPTQPLLSLLLAHRTAWLEKLSRFIK